MASRLINKLCIIGVGLIGGSLARALREQGHCQHITGYSRRTEHLEQAVSLGVIDDFSTDLVEAVSGADVIVVATPLGAMAAMFEQLATVIDDRVLLTDVGSAKETVIDEARAALGPKIAQFVPGHPIAGTERSGVEASFAELFHNRRVILTPIAENTSDAIGPVRDMWVAAGAEVTEMSAAHHDEVLAATSHLPHLLAYGLVDALARMEDRIEIFQYAAGGFRDFTRIASSDPLMWRDICLSNRRAVLQMLAGFQADLDTLTEAIEQADGERILDIFSRAKQARDQYIDGVKA